LNCAVAKNAYATRGTAPLAAQYKPNFEMESRKGTKDIEKTLNARMKMRGRMRMVFAVGVPPVRAKQECRGIRSALFLSYETCCSPLGGEYCIHVLALWDLFLQSEVWRVVFQGGKMCEGI